MSRYWDMTIWELREELRKIESEISRHEMFGSIEIKIDPTLPSGTAEFVSGPHRIKLTGLTP